jgi:hypothetical protein
MKTNCTLEPFIKSAGTLHFSYQIDISPHIKVTLLEYIRLGEENFLGFTFKAKAEEGLLTIKIYFHKSYHIQIVLLECQLPHPIENTRNWEKALKFSTYFILPNRFFSVYNHFNQPFLVRISMILTKNGWIIWLYTKNTYFYLGIKQVRNSCPFPSYSG